MSEDRDVNTYPTHTTQRTAPASGLTPTGRVTPTARAALCTLDRRDYPVRLSVRDASRDLGLSCGSRW